MRFVRIVRGDEDRVRYWLTAPIASIYIQASCHPMIRALESEVPTEKSTKLFHDKKLGRSMRHSSSSLNLVSKLP